LPCCIPRQDGKQADVELPLPEEQQMSKVLNASEVEAYNAKGYHLPVDVLSVIW